MSDKRILSSYDRDYLAGTVTKLSKKYNTTDVKKIVWTVVHELNGWEVYYSTPDGRNEIAGIIDYYTKH